MSRTEALETIELLRERLDRLASFGATKEFVTDKGGALIVFDRERGWESIFEGPSEESRNTVIPNLRLLIRDGTDLISLRKVGTSYEQLNVAPEIRERFQAIRAGLNALLDHPTNIAIEETRNLTYRDVVEIFVLGTLHAVASTPVSSAI